MSALLDSFASAFSGDAARKAALDAILRDGLPGPRSEAWKYTSLRALERRAFSPSAAGAGIDAGAIAHIPAPRIVFVNGIFDAALSSLDGLGTGVELHAASDTPPFEGATDSDGRTDAGPDEVFARLNTALARDGAVLRIAAGAEPAHALHLVFLGVPAEGDVAWHVRHRIELGAGAAARVIEHHLHAGPHAHLGNARTAVHLDREALLDHVRIQEESPAATLLARTDAVLGRDARYRRIDLELGGGLSRHELNVRLEGEGARLSANGVLFGDGRRHLDTRLGIEHTAPDTACDLVWRGLGAGRARAVFHGGIVIHAGADGSDATLSNKNLLLSDGAEIDTQPVLEIHADEVKAAHGATVGQLDPTALFYLRSRGLPAVEARRLLTAAFCREVVSGTADASLRTLLEARVDAALARLETA